MKARKLVLLLLAACGGDPSSEATASAAPPASSAVSTNGRLRVCGVKICNAAGTPVQVKGMSLFWSNTGWGGERFYNATAVSNLATTWNASVVRAAIGVEGQGGYLSSSSAAQANLSRATTVIDAAIAAGIYVVVDWHYSSAAVYQSQAQAFFQQLAQRYASSPNVIWEPYNEPTSNPWSSLKAYHQAIVSTIRAAGSQNLVVVGTPSWSQNVDAAALDKLSDPNVAYTLHFYAGTHGQSLRDKANLAMSRGAAIFVTEWGTCASSGNGSYNPTESARWTSWMDTYTISSANWSLNDKAETASALVGGASATGPWPDGQLTQSGLFVKSYVGRGVIGPASYALTVTNVSQNGGAGTVRNASNQISCGSSCYYRYPSGTVVTLTATVASSSSTFAGWGGPCTGTAPTCTLTMPAQDQNVTATFRGAGATLPITVTKTGAGTGTVTSTPSGINCGATCSGSWAQGTAVTLTATATAPSVFGGWSGPCTGTSAICVVTLAQATSVTADFVGDQALSLVVNVAGAGIGRVFSDVGGISCPGTCSAVLGSGTVVTLSASALVGSTFTGWSDACAPAGTSPTCMLTIGPSRLDVTANFGPTGVVAFTVNKAGSGTGTVTSTPWGIDCGTLCTANFNANSVVTLTVTATPPSVFAGWNGTYGCGPEESICVVALSETGSTTAFFFGPEDLAFYVQVLGIGAGTVTSDVGGISCPGTCSSLLPPGTRVTLTATPASGSTFTGWSGACTGAATTCVITTGTYGLVANATFGVSGLLPLNVGISGVGTGKVTSTSTPAGIDCPTTCSAGFAPGTVVTLTATAVNGTGYLSIFSGWGGACTGTLRTCTVTMSQAQTVVATFTAAYPMYSVTVTKTGTGASSGTVSASGAIDCGSQCQASFDLDTVLTLTATAQPGTTFAGWSGDCSGTASTCALTITRNVAVTATFVAAPSGGCKVTYTPTSQWSGGFGATLLIQNTGTTAWTSWTVTWTYPNASQKITQIWNATLSQTGQAVTVKNASYNGAIPAGGSYASVGFNGTWSGANPTPTAFSVNGVPCS